MSQVKEGLMVINVSQMILLDSNRASPRRSAKRAFVNKLQTRAHLSLGHPSKKVQQQARKPVGNAHQGRNEWVSYGHSFRLTLTEPCLCTGNLLGIGVTKMVKRGT